MPERGGGGGSSRPARSGMVGFAGALHPTLYWPRIKG